jgi:manganese transport system ATP-binding protein
MLDVPARVSGKQRIAYVLQTTKVNDALPITVGEVVAMGRYPGLGYYRRLSAEDKQEVAAAMSRTGIEDMANKHLHELSGGQRQRVFVAQGLVQEHDILMLDEPLTGIDLPTAQAIDEVIHDERGRGCTVIMTTHDLSEAMVADYVVLLSGRVVAAGPPDEVLTTENLTAAYGQSLLHVDQGSVFIDDPAHIAVPGRHVHLQRTIHTDSNPSDIHHGDDD